VCTLITVNPVRNEEPTWHVPIVESQGVRVVDLEGGAGLLRLGEEEALDALWEVEEVVGEELARVPEGELERG